MYMLQKHNIQCASRDYVCEFFFFCQQNLFLSLGSPLRCSALGPFPLLFGFKLRAKIKSFEKGSGQFGKQLWLLSFGTIREIARIKAVNNAAPGNKFSVISDGPEYSKLQASSNGLNSRETRKTDLYLRQSPQHNASSPGWVAALLSGWGRLVQTALPFSGRRIILFSLWKNLPHERR